MWGNQAPIYMMAPPQFGGSSYPGNDVRFIAVPNDNKEALKILKRQLKEMKSKDKPPEKKDETKKRTFSRFETFMLCATTNLLIMMISTLVILIRH